MSTLDEQLALFEKELSSVVGNEAKSDSIINGHQKKIRGPIQANEIDGSAAQTSSTTPTKFVPHQLAQKANNPYPHQQHFNRSFGNPNFRFSMASQSAPDFGVIESGPTLYTHSNSSAKAGLSASNKPVTETSSAASTPPSSSMLQQPGYKTLALPSDVELLMARKQATKAHANSYLGAVLRGEKKMKRFVRSCGGQVWEDASMAEWDPNDFRIFCGDLGNEVSDELLAKAFRKYGSFQKAKVVRDSRTNKSKGYGFVSFKNQEDFIRAMKEMDGKYVGNRPIKLRKSNWKDRNLDLVKKKNKEKKKLGLL